MNPAQAPALRQRVAMVVCAAAVAGCAQCPPFRAAWYLDKPEADAPTIYLALLNEGTQELPLEQVVLNPIGADGRGDVAFASATVPPEVLKPGRLLLLDVGAMLGQCHLPVAVKLSCGDGRARTQAVSGLLPNYLHSKWTEVCLKRGPVGSQPPMAMGSP